MGSLRIPFKKVDHAMNTKYTKKLFILLTVLLLWMVSAACVNSNVPIQNPASNATAEQPPAIVRIGWKGGPDTLNPGMAFLTDSYTIFNLVYDTMYELNLDNTYQLSLAKSVSTSSDGKVWTYTIRSGIQWHDGVPLTAHDIAFTYNFYQSHADFPYLPTYTEHFVSVEAPDDTTVIITLDQPIPNMEAQLVFLYVLPEHIWSQHQEGNEPMEFLNMNLVGSGPFQLAEYKPNEYVHLRANPDYFGTKAKVDEVI